LSVGVNGNDKGELSIIRHARANAKSMSPILVIMHRASVFWFKLASATTWYAPRPCDGSYRQVFNSLLTRNLMYDSVLSIVLLTDGLMSRNHNPD